jgi:outer membrane protein OmpA-like peptidoglycan-associated protein
MMSPRDKVASTLPPPLGPSDTPKSPPERTAALDAAQAPQQPPALPAPAAAKAPEQQAALAPVPQAAPRTGKPGVVSLQAAEINFAANGLTLTPEDDRRLADVVKLYDKHGGIVRVVGYGRRGYGADAAQQELASFSKAIERANVVAKALAGLGLASNRIVVQAAPVGDGLGEDRAEVLLEF